MQFSQKMRLYNRTEFTFGDDSVHYQIDDGRNRLFLDIPYRELNLKATTIQSFAELAFRRYGLALAGGILLGLAFMAESGFTEVEQMFLFGLVFLSLALSILSRKMKFDATLVPASGKHKILIFHDSQHDAILAEMKRRNKEQLRRFFAEVDTLNHPDIEMRRFLWLKEQGIVSEQEFSAAQLKITDAAQRMMAAQAPRS